MTKVINIIILSFLFLGCGAKTGMNPKVRYSGFDQSSIVDIQQHSNDCNPFGACTSMGAQWREATPDKALLIIQMNGELMNIDSVEFNIDGEKFEIRNETLTDHNISSEFSFSSSKSNFLVDLDFIKKLTNANRAWIRLNGYTEYVENRIVDGDKEGWAFNALKRFLVKIEEVKSKNPS
jgi:hypothetical protein